MLWAISGCMGRLPSAGCGLLGLWLVGWLVKRRVGVTGGGPAGQVQQGVGEEEALNGHRAGRAALRVVLPLLVPAEQAEELHPELGGLLRGHVEDVLVLSQQEVVLPFGGPRAIARQV